MATARSARTALLRDLLERVVAIARQADPDGPGAPPRVLRPVLSMTKLTPKALAAADRAGDDDDFRAVVAEAVGDDGLSDAARLWLDRPEGWSDALDALVVARAEAEADGEAREALAREQRSRAKSERARDEARSELERARTELARLTAERAALVDQVRIEEERADTAVAERIRAVRELKGVEARNARTHEELRAARADRDAAIASASRPADPVVAGPVAAEPGTADPAAPGPGSSGPVASDPEVGDGPPPDDGFDKVAAAPAVAAAASAAAALASSLDDLAGALGADRTEPPDSARPALPQGSPRRGPRRTARPAPRRPIGRLPGGLHDDTPEAADHLVRLPRCALLVDGYNATMATWPGKSLPEQRERLVSALDELDARVGVEATVVFDGLEERWASSPTRRVHVHFTPAGTEADDVILGLVEIIADDRPVVVASDDRRVQDGARRRGAHVIGIDQLRSLVV